MSLAVSAPSLGIFVLVVSRQCVPGRTDEEGGPMYIGLGTLALIAVVLLIIYLVRRA